MSWHYLEIDSITRRMVEEAKGDFSAMYVKLFVDLALTHFDDSVKTWLMGELLEDLAKAANDAVQNPAQMTALLTLAGAKPCRSSTGMKHATMSTLILSRLVSNLRVKYQAQFSEDAARDAVCRVSEKAKQLARQFGSPMTEDPETGHSRRH